MCVPCATTEKFETYHVVSACYQQLVMLNAILIIILVELWVHIFIERKKRVLKTCSLGSISAVNKHEDIKALSSIIDAGWLTL